MVRRAAYVLACAMVACVTTATALAAQQSPSSGQPSELTIIHMADALEARGDIAGADKLMRDILAKNPASLSSLITLDRLLGMQGKPGDIEPYIEKLLQIDPQSVIGHQMSVRLYAALNRTADLQRAADLWIAATPDVETPYREIARALEQRGNLTAAAAMLDRGRRRLGGNALALELGDIYAQLHDYDRAVTEWGRNIGRDGQGFLPVQRRLQALPDGGASAIPKLVAALRKDPTTVDRRRAAASIAIDAGMVTDADQLAKQVFKELPAAERVSFLTDLARRADAADAPGAPALAYWAYGEAVRLDTDSTRAFGLRTRLAELALAIGDTAKASRMYLDLQKAAAPGSSQRRQALAARIQLAAGRGDLTAASHDLADFRTEFGTAPELDAIASSVANALLDKGNVDGADAAVAGIKGSRAGLTRGRIMLRRGNVAQARDEILAAAPMLHGSEATQALALATMIMRMSPAGGELLGRSLALNDNVAGAVKLLLDGSKSLADDERAAILDYAASLADHASLQQEADVVRREIVAQYPQSSVAPAALLALAQSIVQRNGSADDARLLLEKIILDYPRSALVPEARRNLDRLLARVPGG